MARKFHAWHDNLLFFRYLGNIAKVMASQRIVIFAKVARPSSAIIPYNCNGAWEDYVIRQGFISISQVFSQSQPLSAPSQSRYNLNIPKTAKPAPNAHLSKGKFRIWELLKRLQAQAVSNFQKRYAANLKENIQALEIIFARPASGLFGNDFVRLRTEFETYKASYINHMDRLLSVLEASIGIYGGPASRTTRPLPKICPRFFIFQFATDRWKLLPGAWKSPIVDYSLAIYNVQRAQRLLDLTSLKRQNELAAKFSNPGHSNWDPLELPLALLMEVETNITIRPIQIYIAIKIINPPGGQNGNMQFNMGEGKLLTIVPLVTAILTSLKEGLVRVIVAKPQSKQMLQMLIAKFGGLLNVVVHRLPFSRNLRLGVDNVAIIVRYLENCATISGILLIYPEHILLFKLMGLECFVNSESVEISQLFLDI